MSGTMARQGGWVQLEQSDMCLSLEMVKIAKGRFSHATIEETQQLIKKPCAKVREAKKRGVEFPGHQKVKAEMERHPAMIYKNHTAGCRPCQHGTAKNLQSRCRRKETAVVEIPDQDIGHGSFRKKLRKYGGFVLRSVGRE